MLRYLLAGAAMMFAAAPAWADWYAIAQTQAAVVDQYAGDVDHVSYACSAPGSYCDQEVPRPNGYTVAYVHDQTSGTVGANSTAAGVYQIHLLNQPPYYVATSLAAYSHAAVDLSRGHVEVSNGGSSVYAIGGEYGGANANAYLNDIVKFHSASTTPYNVGIDFTISGFASDGSQAFAAFDAVPEYAGTVLELGLQYAALVP